MRKGNHPRRSAIHPMRITVATALALMAGHASAMELETGNPDLELRWDNTVKYNLGFRMNQRDKTLGDTWMLQGGNHQFDRGDIVTNRIDLISEVDLIYKKNFGARVSGMAWYDGAYNGDVDGNPAYKAYAQANPAFGQGNAYPNYRMGSTAKRYYTKSGELLDAFVFGKVDVGEVPISMRLGRHTVYWGESLFSPIHGVSYSQSAADFRKAAATPGIEAKEMFLPLNQLSMQVQPTNDISIAGQYQMEWAPYRIAEGGTFQSAVDPFFLGGTLSGPQGPAFVGDMSSGPYKKPGNTGSWGVNTRIKSAALGGTLGVYYRKFDDKLPNIVYNAQSGVLQNAYAKDVKLAGLSFSTLVGSTSVGMELVHRQDTALASNGGGLATGSTWHAVLNSVTYFGKTALFDSAPLTMELTYSKLHSINSGSEAFFNRITATCGARNGCASDDALGFQMSFAPVWYQVFPSVDISLPISAGIGISGNSPVPFGGNEGSGTYSLGVGFDYQQKYKLDVAYNDAFGNYTAGPNPYFGVVPGIGPRAMASSNGSGLTHDRGWLSITFKTNF